MRTKKMTKEQALEEGLLWGLDLMADDVHNLDPRVNLRDCDRLAEVGLDEVKGWISGKPSTPELEVLELGGGSGTIGGSNIAGILGISPWETPWTTWNKIVNNPPWEDTEATLRGKRLEPIVAELFERRTGMVLTEREIETVRHPTDHRFTASTDRKVWNSEGALVGLAELKTSSSFGDWSKGVPDYYYNQLQHYLWVESALIGQEIRDGWFCCLQATAGRGSDEAVFRMIETVEDAERAIKAGLARLWIYDVIQDLGYQKVILPKLRAFFDNHIAPGIPPEVDGTERCTEGLRALYPGSDEHIEATDELIKAARTRKFFSEMEKNAKREKDKAGNAIRSILQGRKSAVNREALELLQSAETAKQEREARKAITVKVELGQREGRIGFDKDSLQAEHPEIFEKYMRRGKSFDVITISGSEFEAMENGDE